MIKKVGIGKDRDCNSIECFKLSYLHEEQKLMDHVVSEEAMMTIQKTRQKGPKVIDTGKTINISKLSRKILRWNKIQ